MEATLLAKLTAICRRLSAGRASPSLPTGQMQKLPRVASTSIGGSEATTLASKRNIFRISQLIQPCLVVAT